MKTGKKKKMRKDIKTLIDVYSKPELVRWEVNSLYLSKGLSIECIDDPVLYQHYKAYLEDGEYVSSLFSATISIISPAISFFISDLL